jgi:membrane protease YdiL (CAAX protease family)
MDKNQLLEISILGIIGYLLFLNSTVINPTLAFIYTILLVISFAFVLGDGIYGRRQVPLTNKSISWGKALLISGIAYIILIAGSYLASSLAKIIPLSEILSLLGSSAPIFSSSPVFNFINFAILIPFIETFAIFAIAIDFFSSAFNIDLKISPKMVFLIVIISIAFLFFHIQAKGIENEVALILVFLMAMISCVLVIIYRESRIAILFHVIANTIGLLTFSSVNIVSVALPVLPLLILIIPKLKRNIYKVQDIEIITKHTSDSHHPPHIV